MCDGVTWCPRRSARGSWDTATTSTEPCLRPSRTCGLVACARGRPTPHVASGSGARRPIENQTAGRACQDPPPAPRAAHRARPTRAGAGAVLPTRRGRSRHGRDRRGSPPGPQRRCHPRRIEKTACTSTSKSHDETHQEHEPGVTSAPPSKRLQHRAFHGWGPVPVAPKCAASGPSHACSRVAPSPLGVFQLRPAPDRPPSTRPLQRLVVCRDFPSWARATARSRSSGNPPCSGSPVRPLSRRRRSARRACSSWGLTRPSRPGSCEGVA